MKSVLAGGSCTAAMLAFSLVAYAQTTGQTQSGQSGSQPSSQSQQVGQSAQQQVTIVGCVQSEGDYRRAKGAGHGGAVGTGVGAGNEFVLINASHSSASGAPGSDTQAGTSATGSTTGSATGTTGTSTGTTGTTSGTATTAPGTAGGMPSTSGTPSSTAGGVAGTTGAHNAFELTGPGEGQLQQFVGRRVEIVGRIKSGHAAHGASGSTSGTASGSATTGTGSTTGTASGSTGTQSGTSTGTQGSGTTTGTQSGVAGATKGGSDIMGQDLNLPELEVVSVREASGSCPATQGQNPQ